MMKDLSVYIHIPFCLSKCKYCDFTSAVERKDIKEKYVKALIKEINAFNFDGYRIRTVYIGGGTPTSLADCQLLSIVETVYNISGHSIEEFTVEANPNSVSSELIEKLVEYGVTRISIGAQCLNDKVLTAIGRTHTSTQVLDAIELTKRYVKDINIDYMVGLPFQTVEDVERDITTLLNSGINHLSCYSLILETGTPLEKEVANGTIKLPDEDETVDMYDIAMDILEQNGLMRYEISNFGKPCLHNIAYWTLKNYIGFGLSAHSYLNNIRYSNTSDMKDYLSGAKAEIVEVTDIEEEFKEFIMLGLRMDIGINLNLLKNKYGENKYKRFIEYVNNNDIYFNINNNALSIKRKYSYVSNSLIGALMEI